MKSDNGSARHRLIAFLPVLALVIYVGAMIGPRALAQVLGTAPASSDPCAIYPHRSVFIPNGTPTAKLIQGVDGYEIDVCRVSVENANNGTAIAETFYQGAEANASGTPCATATTGGPGAVATMGAISAANNTSIIGGDGGHTVFHVTNQPSGFPIDFCGLMGGGTGLIGQLDYVMVKP